MNDSPVLKQLKAINATLHGIDAAIKRLSFEGQQKTSEEPQQPQPAKEPAEKPQAPINITISDKLIDLLKDTNELKTVTDNIKSLSTALGTFNIGNLSSELSALGVAIQGIPVNWFNNIVAALAKSSEAAMGEGTALITYLGKINTAIGEFDSVKLTEIASSINTLTAKTIESAGVGDISSSFNKINEFIQSFDKNALNNIMTDLQNILTIEVKDQSFINAVPAQIDSIKNLINTFDDTKFKGITSEFKQLVQYIEEFDDNDRFKTNGFKSFIDSLDYFVKSYQKIKNSLASGIDPKQNFITSFQTDLNALQQSINAFNIDPLNNITKLIEGLTKSKEGDTALNAALKDLDKLNNMAKNKDRSEAISSALGSLNETIKNFNYQDFVKIVHQVNRLFISDKESSKLGVIAKDFKLIKDFKPLDKKIIEDITKLDKQLNLFNITKLEKYITLREKYAKVLAASPKTNWNQVWKNAGRMSESFAIMGLGITSIAGSLALGSVILSTTPMGVLGYVLATAGTLALSMFLISGGEIGSLQLSKLTSGITETGEKGPVDTNLSSRAVLNAKNMGIALGIIGLGIGTFALGLKASAVILGVPIAVVPLAVLGIIAGIALSIVALSYITEFDLSGLGKEGGIWSRLLPNKKEDKNVNSRAIDNAKNMGLALMYIAGGIVAFAAVMPIAKALLGVTTVVGVGASILGIIAMIGISIVVLSTLTGFGEGLFGKKISGTGDSSKAVDNAKGMGVALMYISGGILAFAATMFIVPKLLQSTSVLGAMGIISLIIVGMAAIFGILALVSPFIEPGIRVTEGMGIAVAIISLSILMIAATSKILMSMFKDGKDEGDKDRLGPLKPLGNAARGLGMFGMFVIGLAGTLWLLGLPVISAPMMMGSGALLFAAISLIALTKAVKAIQANMPPDTKVLKDNISSMVGAVIGGVRKGVYSGFDKDDDGSDRLTVRELNQFRKVTKAIRMLSKVSSSLSKFAQGLKAFQEVGSIYSLEYTEDAEGNLKPVLTGEKVHVEAVGKAIATTFGMFIESLVNNTEGLTKKHARTLRILGRTLTGKRGILEAVSKFSEVLKTYAKFGEKGEIFTQAYDAEGNVVEGSKLEPVKLTTVVDNIIKTFGLFITELSAKTENLTLEKTFVLGRLGKILSSERGGILVAVGKFAETLKTFAQFGAKGEIWVQAYNEDGTIKEGKKESVSVQKVSDLIVSTFLLFVGNLVEKTKNLNISQAAGLKSLGKTLSSDKGGLLDAVAKFSDILKLYSEYGDKGEIFITAYDENGNEIPNKRQSVSIVKITENITKTFSTFISGLVESTKNIKTKESRRLKDVSKILSPETGGIISAISEFSGTLKAFSYFGAENKIMIPEVKDENGNIITPAKSIPVQTISDNIINAFGGFIQKIAASADDFSLTGRFGRQMKRLSVALLGEKGRRGQETPGILDAIISFSDVITKYADYGENNMIPSSTGVPVSVDKIAQNMVSSISVFLTALNTEITNKGTSIETLSGQVQSKIKKFSTIITEFDKLAKSQEGIERLASSMGLLATNLAQLSTTMRDLDVDKLANVAKIKYTSEERTVVVKRTAPEVPVQTTRAQTQRQITEETRPSTSPPTTASPGQPAAVGTAASIQSPSPQATKEPDWDKIADRMGQIIADKLSRFGTGNFKFEFLRDNQGNLTVSS